MATSNILRDFVIIQQWGGRKWAFTVFLTIAVLHILAILLFTRGFLLTRTELSQHSHCSDVSRSPCFPPRDITNGCWTKPAVDRLVIVVFDALRFDFVAPSTFFEEKKPWMDKLQVLHDLASRHKSSARIFKAIADPPTTSLQRLKGLTTGGLPTFIDIGNSFGATEIVEDNLIHQLVQNGKRVVMMGDDTWVQLFPHHFNVSYPFPSFNVKDLHTVDNGCIMNLLPSLYRDDWDVLIAHFLGVDHAGHISGVDSPSMIEKLEQYNNVVKEVVEVLESQSGPGALHENTMLLLMGDHGQTINGDHGGGSAEEVETSLFAWSLKKPATSPPAGISNLSCQLDLHGRRICISSIQQLDFAVTVSALLGIPFPFGSIGRVNPELYALASDTWNQKTSDSGAQNISELDTWIQNYANALCINSWQVKNYIDVYSSLSLIGFSEKDLLHVSELYAEAQDLWLLATNTSASQKNEKSSEQLPSFKKLLDLYSTFLESVAALARSSWTEFNLKMMGLGFCILLISLCMHVLVIRSVICRFVSFIHMLPVTFVFIHLSNAVEEGRVASFLLATTAMLQLRHAVMKKKMLTEAVVFGHLVLLLRISIELKQLKQAVNSLFLKIDPSRTLGIVDVDSQLFVYLAELMPMVALAVVAYVLYKIVVCYSSLGISKSVIVGTLFTYLLIAIDWAKSSSLLGRYVVLGEIDGNLIPRIVYLVGLLQVLLLVLAQLFVSRRNSRWEKGTADGGLVFLSAWSSTIILLSGKQGALFVLASLVGGWCIIRFMRLEEDADNGSSGSSLSYALPVTQWSLLAVCMFFSTGHWCTFDGLRYAAAFIGFDEFNLIPQAILLTIDTFGFSVILPILGLPLLVAYGLSKPSKKFSSMLLCQAYLMYGLIATVTLTFTMICVTIHRRHLMVWGLFAPKFVFDVVALIITDILICLSSLLNIV